MSYWNYRVCKHPEGHYSLHEVYYDDHDKATSMTANPIHFLVDEEEGPEGIVKDLEMALMDAKERPVFIVPEKWGGDGNDGDP
ncbi:MAG: hypothetical protein HQL67_11680 [Magnetococcales bacterium]|nr:hypothetical protein [Magnetococcales bacterium]